MLTMQRPLVQIPHVHINYNPALYCKSLWIKASLHGFSHKVAVGFFLVDLVSDVVNVGREVVLSMIVDDVTDVRDHQRLIHPIFQVLQKPVHIKLNTTEEGSDILRFNVNN